MDAVFFDMDGVLVNSPSYNRARKQRFIEEITTDIDIDAGFLALYSDKLYRCLRDKARLTADADEFARRLREAVNDRTICEEQIALLSEFQSIASELDASNVPGGLVSASTAYRVGLIVARFELTETFGVILSTENVPGQSKPSPDVYEHAASLLGVEPECCVAVEDSAVGSTAARRAGMYCIGYCTPESPTADLNAANEVVETAAALRRRVSAMVGGE